jgi:hypothetical protein
MHRQNVEFLRNEQIWELSRTLALGNRLQGFLLKNISLPGNYWYFVWNSLTV